MLPAPLLTDLGVLEDGAEILNQADVHGHPPESEVDVQIRGSIEIALKVGLTATHIPASLAFTQWVVLPEVALNMLQPYPRVRQEIPPFGPASPSLRGRHDDAP
jgi:hypothetical protein